MSAAGDARWAEARSSTSHDRCDALAREVLRVRLSLMRINDRIKQRAFRIPIHLAFGHEALAVGLSEAMEEGDRLLLTHRNVHYHLARHPDLPAGIAEYELSPGGIGGGRYGAMNLIHPARGIAYTSSILANCLPVAVGVAKALRTRDPKTAVFAVTGDGAIEEGAFYEALMMARSLRLPVVFVVENNGWSMYTRIEERRCSLDLAGMARTFDVSFDAVTGNDPAVCHELLSRVRLRASEQACPALVEVSLSTLGDDIIEEPGRPARHANYHHGPVSWLDSRDDPILARNERDPVYVASRRYTPERWDALVNELRGELGEASC